jgi:hypothetical protein
MKKVILILLILGFFSCSNNQQVENINVANSETAIDKELEDFNLISDFEKDRKIFTSDTFDLMNLSIERGELIAFHTSKKNYIVIDIWLYGEMGKQHTIYWTNKNIEFKIIKETRYDYDKPMNETDFKIKETTNYYSYSDSTFKVFDQNRHLIEDILFLTKRKEIDERFKEIIEEVKIIK